MRRRWRLPFCAALRWNLPTSLILAATLCGQSRCAAKARWRQGRERTPAKRRTALSCRPGHRSSRPRWPASCRNTESTFWCAVPVSRAALVREEEGFAGWQAPPLPLSIPDVKLGDTLRVELHEEPALERGLLLCWLVGGGEVAAGEAAGQPRTFVVPLHRWRDALGGASGLIQVRAPMAGSPWSNSKANRGRPRLPYRRSRRPMTGAACYMNWSKPWLARIPPGWASLPRSARAMSKAAHASAVDRERLPLAAARAWIALGDLPRAEQCLEGLLGRADLPEALLLQTCCDLRGGRCCDPVDLMDRMDLLKPLPLGALTALIQAETQYHHARALCLDATGTWETIEQLTSQEVLGTTGPDLLDAWLLRAVALIMRSRLTQIGPPPRPGWAAALAFVTDWLRHPLSPSRRGPPPAPDSPALVLHPRDRAWIHAALALAEGDAHAAERGLDDIRDWTGETFFLVGLLRARLARLQRRLDAARSEYNALRPLVDRPERGFLLSVVVAERP